MPKTVILMMVDQLGAKWLEAARDGVVDLPNFDALQAEGVTFDATFTTNPVCSPSRATVFTGMSPSTHGLTETGYDLGTDIPTFPRALQHAGWATGAFGKVHLVALLEDWAADYRPYGFDVVDGTEDTRVGEWLDWVELTHPEHYEAALSTVWMTMAPGLDAYGPDRIDLRARIEAARRTHPGSAGEAYVLPFPPEVSQTAWITDRAIDFLRSVDSDRDLFAHISYVQPHNPFTPPADYVDSVDVAAIPEPAPAEWLDGSVSYYRQERYARPSYDEHDWRRHRQLYFADLAHLDHELGRIRDALREVGRTEDVLLLFTSDHGELLHDHGLLGKWERHYDACIRVPLIIAAPGAEQGRRAQLAELTDIAPTVYDWAGVAPPELPVRRVDGTEETMPMVHGLSLIPQLTDPSAPTRTSVFIQSNNSHVEASPRSWARTVRTERHRYTRHLDGGGEQLFDVRSDPDEQHNLADDPGSADVRRHLADLLTERTALDAFPNSPRQLFRIGTW